MRGPRTNSVAACALDFEQPRQLFPPAEKSSKLRTFPQLVQRVRTKVSGIANYSVGGVPLPPAPSLGGPAFGVGVSIGVGVAVGAGVGVFVGEGVAVGAVLSSSGACVAVRVGVAVRAGFVVRVGVPGTGVAVATRVDSPATVEVASAGAALPPVSWAASTWFWDPSSSSIPAPDVPWSWLSSEGSRDELASPGGAGVTTEPSAAYCIQPVEARANTAIESARAGKKR